MGKFSSALKRFTEIKKEQAHWKNKSELQAMRGVYMAASAVCSSLAGISVLTFTNNLYLASFVATSSLGFFLPTSIWLASKQWKKRYRVVIQDDDDFNWRMFLEDEYEERIRRIENLGLARKDTDILKLEAYREHQAVLTQFQVSLAARPRNLPAPSEEEVKSILKELNDNPEKRQMVQNQLNRTQKVPQKRLP